MSRTAHPKTPYSIKLYQNASLVIYLLVIVLASATLIIEPNNFDARMMTIPLIALLFLSSIGIGHKIAYNSKSRIISNLGTLALAIMFTFLGFFVVATVTWFVALSHAY